MTFTTTLVRWALVTIFAHPPTTQAWVLPKASSFMGQPVASDQRYYYETHNDDNMLWTMRKQKASDRRTRRLQRNDSVSTVARQATATISPMETAVWKHRRVVAGQPLHDKRTTTKKGRGRSRKRATQYQVLQHYQQHFLDQLTAEYKAEVGTIDYVSLWNMFSSFIIV